MLFLALSVIIILSVKVTVFLIITLRKLCKCRINDGKRNCHKDFVVLNFKVYLKFTQSLLYDPASVSFRAFPLIQ